MENEKLSRKITDSVKGCPETEPMQREARYAASSQ